MKVFARIATGIVLVLLVACSQKEPQADVDWCHGDSFAQLNRENQRCSARLEAQSRAFCLASELWEDVLRSKAHCFQFKASWKASRNEEGEWVVEQVGVRPSKAPLWARASRGIERLRWKTSLAIGPHDSTGVLRKFVLDERSSRLSLVPWRELGFVHLLTATGIHIVAFSDLLSFGAEKIYIFTRGSRLVRPILWVVHIGWVLVLWLVSGMRAGFIRPALLFGLRFWATRQGYKPRFLSGLAFACLIDCFIAAVLSGFQPQEDIFAPGRAHYALAVAGGLLGWRSGKRGWRGHFAMALGSWLFTVPLDLIEHHRLAPLTPLLSLVTIPLMANVVFPACAIALFEDAGWRWIGKGLSSVLELFLWLTRECGAVWIAPPSMFVFCVLLFACLWLLWPRHARWVSVALVLAGVGVRETSINLPRVRQLDVGQGDAALWVNHRGEATLIDTGSRFSMRPSDWWQVLAANGISKVSRVILTHLDEDHAGGWERIFPWVEVDEVWVRSFLAPEWAERNQRWPSSPVSLKRLEVGETLRESGAGFFFLPWKEGRRNSGMLGIWIDLNDAVYINLGDAGVDDERTVFPSIAQVAQGRPLIWKLSHHGSRSSTPPELFHEFPIREVWVSSGKRNHYGHPHRDVLALIPRDVSVRRTDQCEYSEAAGDLLEATAGAPAPSEP